MPSSPIKGEVSTTTTTKKSKVLIIGAGISGLSLGVQILKHASKYYEPVIFEKSKCLEDVSGVGFVVNITLNAIHVLEGMGFDVNGLDFVFPMNRAVLHDSRTKDTRPLAVVEGIFDDAGSLLTVERGPLQSLLLEKYRELGGEIHFDKSLVSVERNDDMESEDCWKLAAFFEDGTSERGDVLVGADGIHSRVRKYLHSVLQEKESEARKKKKVEPSPALWWVVVFLRGLFHWLLWILCCCRPNPTRKKDDDDPTTPPTTWEATPTSWTALYGITSPVPKHLQDKEEDKGTMHWYACETGGYSTYPLPNNRVFWIAHEVQRPYGPRSHYTRTETLEAVRGFDDKPYINGTVFGELTAHTERMFKTRVYNGVWDRIADEDAGVALVGDAAHATAIYVGQAAVLGIEESVVLTNGLLRKKWREIGILPPKPPFPSPPVSYTLPWWFRVKNRSRNKSKKHEELVLSGMVYYEAERLDRCRAVASISWWLGWSLMGEEKFWRVVRDALMTYWLPWMVKETKRALAKRITKRRNATGTSGKEEKGAQGCLEQPALQPSKDTDGSQHAAATNNRKKKVCLRDRKMGKWDHWLFDAKFEVDEEVDDLEAEKRDKEKSIWTE